MLAPIIVLSIAILAVAGNECCDCTDSKYSPNCNEGCDATICSYDPYCCQWSWDWICANAAGEECNTVAPPSGSTACCECTDSSSSANCNEGCDGTICSYDPYCCNWSWDWICADAAKSECEAAGGNAEESADEGEEQETEPVEGSNEACCDCTESEQGSGCSANPACDPIVCPLDSYCCNWSWDGICANGAQNICNSVDYWSWPKEEETGSCCDCTGELYGAGCNEVCDNEVCGLDNYCCNNQWDGTCANGASNICQGYDYYGSSDYGSADWYDYGFSYSAYEPNYDSFGSYDYSFYSPSGDYGYSFEPYYYSPQESYYEPYNSYDSYSYSWDNEPYYYGFDSYYPPSEEYSYYGPYSFDNSYSYSTPGPYSYEPYSYSTPGPYSWDSSYSYSTPGPYSYDSFSYDDGSYQPYYYYYDQEDEDDCFMNVCGQSMFTCASSPDCYDGFMEAEAECEKDTYESMEICVEQLVQDSSSQQIIGFCNNNETAAGDLQALGQCFLNLQESGECNEDEKKKLKFKKFVKAVKKAKKLQKSKATKKPKAGSKRARSAKVQRRKHGRSQRKVRSQRPQRVRPSARRTLAQRQRRPRLSRRVRSRVQRRQRPQRSRRYRARSGRAHPLARRRRQRLRQRPRRVQRARELRQRLRRN